MLKTIKARDKRHKRLKRRIERFHAFKVEKAYLDYYKDAVF